MNGPREAEDRYQQFLSECRESREVFAAYDSRGPAGWSYEGGEQPLCLFWSNEKYAQACIDARLAGYVVRTFTLQEFVDAVLPQLHEQGFWIAVNWNSEMIGLEVSPAVLTEELRVVN